MICIKANGSTLGWWFLLEMSAGKKWLEVQRFGSAVTGVWNGPASSIAVNTWYAVAFTHDDSNNANDPQIFINGVSQTVTRATAPTGTAGSDTTQNMNWGANSGGFDGFVGMFEHGQYFSGILTAAHIDQAGKNPGSLTTNLKGYWKMLTNTSNQNDVSGNGNHGTLTGGAHGPLAATINRGIVLANMGDIGRPLGV